MSWRIKDEFISLAQARHVVIFHNPDTKAEHHLIHEFNVKACPHCGTPHHDANGELLDFEKLKAETLAALTAHHAKVMQYRAKHKHVRIGDAPKP